MEEQNTPVLGKRMFDHMLSQDSSSGSSNSESEEISPPKKKITTNGETKQTTTQKREGYLSWEDYFMSVAFLSAMRSKGLLSFYILYFQIETHPEFSSFKNHFYE